MRACRTQSLSVITRQCPPRQKKWAIPYCRKLYQSGPFHSLHNSIKVGDSILYKILSKWAILYCTDFYQSGLFHTVQILSKWVIPYRTKFYQRQQSSILYRPAKSGLILTASHYPCSNAGHALTVHPKLQALVYDTLPSTTAVFSYAIRSRKLSANEQFFCWCSNLSLIHI